MCAKFNVSAVLTCEHTIPYAVAEGNAVGLLHGELTLASGYVNNHKVQVFQDSGSKLIGVQKRLCPPRRLYRRTYCNI